MTKRRVLWIEGTKPGQSLNVHLAVYSATEDELIMIGEAAALAGMVSRSPLVAASDYPGAELLYFTSHLEP